MGATLAQARSVTTQTDNWIGLLAGGLELQAPEPHMVVALLNRHEAFSQRMPLPTYRVIVARPNAVGARACGFTSQSARPPIRSLTLRKYGVPSLDASADFKKTAPRGSGGSKT